MEEDYELTLFDRLEVIKQTINKYGEENFYLSFSGGKDSTVVHYLLDMALPNNNIPRVFINTGIDYLDIIKFVNNLAKKDKRFVIIKPTKPIKKILEIDGYPIKSKQHSHNLSIYQNNIKKVEQYRNMIENNKGLLNDYNFIHSLPNGVKTVIKYLYGVREKNNELYFLNHTCPEILKYQFTPAFNLKSSDKCCYRMKKEPAHLYEINNNKSIKILGLRENEGGMRNVHTGCVAFDSNNNLKEFKPINPISDEFEEWFINKYNIQLCKLYYPPFNFKRTGCRGCPYALELQKQLEIMQSYLPNEAKSCEIIWKPVYDEYRTNKYRLKEKEEYKQLRLF